MGKLICIIAWTFQIGITLLLACIIPVIIIAILRKKGIQCIKKTFLLSTAICFLLLSLTIIYIANNPIIRCSDELEYLVTEDMKKYVISYNKGFYSAKVPIFPVFIDILSVNDNKVVVQTNYFYFGNIQMEIIDGEPSINKPLL